MLSISQAILDELSNRQAESFIDRIATFAQTHFPELAGVGALDLHEAIVLEVQAAERVGLITELNIVSYVIDSILLGSNFAKHVEILGVLNDSRSSDEKAAFLEALLLSNEMLGIPTEAPRSGS